MSNKTIEGKIEAFKIKYTPLGSSIPIEKILYCLVYHHPYRDFKVCQLLPNQDLNTPKYQLISNNSLEP